MVSSEPLSDPASTLQAVEADVVRELIRRLEERNSPLIADPEVAGQLRAQVGRVLRGTAERLGHPAGGTPPSVLDVGQLRARQHIHPMDSLTAATLLFDVALDELERALSGCPDRPEPSALARALNAAIMDSVAPASVAYVDVLLERLAVAHREERLGISRELHDRVAHGIAVGIQRIQLGMQHPGAPDRIAEALTLLESALDETRSLAADLRHSVGDKALDEAIADYVADLGVELPQVDARSEGAARPLPSGVREEAFVIVREAIHNARRHSGADRIQVTSRWMNDRLVVTVADDGTGFERDSIRPGALGLITAQERAELIGAELALETGPGAGTTVTLTLAHREAS